MGTVVVAVVVVPGDFKLIPNRTPVTITHSAKVKPTKATVVSRA